MDRRGHLGAATVLLKLGADPNAQAAGDVYETPLHAAVRRGYLATCRLLLQNGADPCARTQRLETPLHVAAREGRVAMARLLLIAGADLALRARDRRTARAAAQAAKAHGCYNWLRKVEEGRIRVERLRMAELRARGWRMERKGRKRRANWLAKRSDGEPAAVRPGPGPGLGPDTSPGAGGSALARI